MGKEGETSAATAYAAVRPKVKNQKGKGCPARWFGSETAEEEEVERRDRWRKQQENEKSVQVGIGVCFARCVSIYRHESYLNGRVTTSSRLSRRPRRAHKNRRLQSPDG
ncbi:unnamed protein product [Musa banksii]